MRNLNPIRRTVQRLLLSLWSGCVVLAAQATTYYVAETGNDANSGNTQAQAWRTVDRVNQIAYTMQPGDQVLFKKGGIYRGTLIIGSSGTTSSPITVGAYGSGAAPVLAGSTALTGWTVHSGNIWKVPVTTPVKYLFSGGQLMTLARFPNTGWLRNDNGSSTEINDAGLTQAAGYWNGAEVVVRSSNWSYDVAPVTGHTAGRLQFNNIWFDLDTNHWGYFLRNKLSELDAQNEWFYDAAAGLLYFRAPNNADPNTLLVEASTVDRGVWVQLNRHDVVVDGLTFHHQHERGVFIDGAHHVTVRNCTFEDLAQSMYSYGHDDVFQNNIVRRTFKTGLYVIDNNTVISGNLFQDVAMEPGLGESNWGYMGVRVSGNNNTVRENRLETIGYIGISVESNTLVERNFVQHALALLNDGCGIGMDNSNGMIIQDNIIVDITGNLESGAPNSGVYWPIAFGIYFGNLSVQNTIIRRNTIANCSGGGMHVDHTMLSQGNQIVDNLLFNNAKQISLSDFSNFTGPGAVAPFSMPSYNQTISGNVFHSITSDQLCMHQLQVWTPGWCDFGTFSNNRFINPYNDQSIYIEDLNQYQWRRFTLARWQAEQAEETGSTPSPVHYDPYAVTNVIGANLVANGTFDNNVTGWSGWPNNAQVTQDYTFLDNGALKANLPNANVYPSFSLRNPDPFAMQSGQWYRMQFSIQSNAHGEVECGVKGSTQMTGPQMIHKRNIPFDGTRRDVNLFFQSALSDQSLVQFTNSYTEPMYWLDNVRLERVAVQPIDPLEQNKLLYNDQLTAQTFAITGCWRDAQGTLHSGSITLAPFSGISLMKEDDILCGLSTGVDENNDQTSRPAIYPNPVHAGGEVFFAKPADGGRLDIFDVQGRLQRSEVLSNGQRSITLDAGLATGVYTLVAQGTSSTWHGRLVVE